MSIDAGVLAGPFYAVAGLLVVAGIAKLAAPAAAAKALRNYGVTRPGVAVRLLGTAEVVVGVAALSTGSRPAAAATAVLYLGFAGYVIASMRQPQPAPCGCFGAADVPPGWVHLAVDAAAAAVAMAVLARPVGTPLDVLDDGVLAAATFMLYVGLAVYLLYVALTSLPRAVGTRS